VAGSAKSNVCFSKCVQTAVHGTRKKYRASVCLRVMEKAEETLQAIKQQDEMYQMAVDFLEHAESSGRPASHPWDSRTRLDR